MIERRCSGRSRVERLKREPRWRAGCSVFISFPLSFSYTCLQRKESFAVSGLHSGRVSASPAQRHRRVVQSVSHAATESMPAPPPASSSRSQDAGSSSSSRAPPAASSNQVGSAAPTARPAKSSQPLLAPSSGARSRAPSSASGGGGGGPTTRPRAQSNVGAKLLKKRQSVAYNQHPGLFATADGQASPAPAVPAIPQGLVTTAGPASSSSAAPPRPLAPADEGSSNHHASSSNKSSSSRQAPAPVVRTDAEKQLLAKGLDVDQLASDSFKPEDCKKRSSYNRCSSSLTRGVLSTVLKQNLPSSRTDGDVQMSDLRRFKGDLESASKTIEGGLQRSVFEYVLPQTEGQTSVAAPHVDARSVPPPPAATTPNSSSSPRRLPPSRARCSS